MIEPRNILVVDDDPQIAEVMCAAIQMCGGTPAVAGTLEAGRFLSNQIAFALVLLDLGLPDSSYPGTLAAIEEFRSRGAQTVVVVTGYANDEIRTRALGSGAADLLEKADAKFTTKLCELVRSTIPKLLDKPKRS